MIFAHEHLDWIILVTSDLITWNNEQCRLRYKEDVQYMVNEGWILVGEI